MLLILLLLPSGRGFSAGIYEREEMVVITRVLLSYFETFQSPGWPRYISVATGTRRHMSSIRALAYLAMACATIVVGLVVHLYGAALGPVARDVLGDALWAMMIALWGGVLAPHARLAVRCICAYAVCGIVEVSQLHHTATLDAVRATTLGHLVLGSGFDPRDLVAYAGGVALAALLEWTIVRRRMRPLAT